MHQLWITAKHSSPNDPGVLICGPYLPKNSFNIGKLFREVMRDFGRCTGKYFDPKEEFDIQTGWKFVKRIKSGKETYLRETIVTIQIFTNGKFWDAEISHR